MRIINPLFSFLILNAFMQNYIHSQVQDNNPGPPGGNGLNVECVNDLQIKNFSGEKDFKVVVSQTKQFNINLKGLDPTQSAPYKWELGNFPSGSFRWPLKPVNTLSGKTSIDINALNTFAMPQSNDEFGSKNGVVKITDNNGNFRLSTDPFLNKKVEVFYEKDAPNPLNPSEPNWFYYWKQFVDIKKIASIEFKTKAELALKEVYGKSNVYACLKANSSRKAFFAQESSEINYVTNSTGIHSFLEILDHENNHILLFEYFWPGGYMPDNSLCSVDLIGGPYADCDKDYYPTWFETSQEGIEYGFQADDDTDAYNFKPTGALDYESIGYRYEEKKCRLAEKNADKTKYDNKDWSFDKHNKNQGKNWMNK